jgi:hypothetical protein
MKKKKKKMNPRVWAERPWVEIKREVVKVVVND